MNSPAAMVLLEHAVLPERQALVTALRQRHPGLRWDNNAGVANAEPDGPILIRAGDHLVTIMSVPAPLPYDQELWQRACWMWPEAFDAARRHRAHLVISTIVSAETRTALPQLTAMESARLTTAVAGGVIGTLSGCLGVLWSGKVGRSAEMWLDDSRRSFGDFPDHPFPLWIDIVRFRSGETIGARTVGLSEFTGREVEIEVDGLDELEVTSRIVDVASYLMANGLDAIKSGAVFEDDGKIGPVAVLYCNSRFGSRPIVSLSSLQDPFGRLRTYEIIPATIARNHPLLIILGKAGLFDAGKAENQIKLRPDHYVSDVRLESYDRGISGALSGMLATDAYIEADGKARRALASGDVQSAKLLLLPFAKDVDRLQSAVKLALTLRDLFMFAPAPPRRP